MSKQIKFGETESLEIEGIILVTYDLEIEKRPENIVECHGFHRINEDTFEVTITSVELVIKGVGIDVTSLLSVAQKEELKNGISIN